MTEKSNTVRSLLPDKYQHIDEVMQRELQTRPGIANERLPGFMWQLVGDQATEAIRDALDTNVFAIFAYAWCKAVEIREQAKESLKRPGEDLTLSLGKHKAEVKLHPVMDVTIVPIVHTRIPFTVVMTAEFGSARLTLRDGAITAIRAGQCKVALQLMCADQPLHPPRKSPELNLGKPHRIEPGLIVVRPEAMEGKVSQPIS